jgi:glycosyltransferase involved in cell wall biosynthesis
MTKQTDHQLPATNRQPLVSVIMPVYNPGDYLVDAIESILNQTYQNFEFIIVDDASTDDSWKIIKSYTKKDKRIRSYKNPLNLGVSLTSNFAISKVRGNYIARMDSDDVSAPTRLQKQVAFLNRHPKTVLVGGQCTIIDQFGHSIGSKNFPLSPHQVLMEMLFWAVPVQQGFMMVNRTLLPQNFIWYSASKTSAEEIDLFFNLSQYGDFANLPYNLYYYRQIPGSLSRANPKKTFRLTLQARLNAIKNGHRPSVKAVLINLAQIIVVSIVPSSVMYDLWYFVRGVSQFRSQLSLIFGRSEIKS